MGKIEERPGQVSFLQAIKDFFRGYVDFKGRSTRAGYWWMRLILGVLGIIFFVVFLLNTLRKVLEIIPLDDIQNGANLSSAQTDQLSSLVFSMIVPIIIAGLVALALIVPNIALTVRRLRDAGLRGRAQLTLFLIYFVINIFVNNATTTTMLANGDFSANLIINPLPAVYSLVLFILTVLPTGTLATTHQTGIFAFFFKNKSFYQEQPQDEYPDF